MKTKSAFPLVVIFCLVVFVFESIGASGRDGYETTIKRLKENGIKLSGIPSVWGISDDTSAGFHKVSISNFQLNRVRCLNGRQFSEENLANCEDVLADEDKRKVRVYLNNKNRLTFSSIKESNNRYEYLTRLHTENPDYFNRDSNLNWPDDPIFDSFENRRADDEGRSRPHTPENFKKTIYEYCWWNILRK